MASTPGRVDDDEGRDAVASSNKLTGNLSGYAVMAQSITGGIHFYSLRKGRRRAIFATLIIFTLAMATLMYTLGYASGTRRNSSERTTQSDATPPEISSDIPSEDSRTEADYSLEISPGRGYDFDTPGAKDTGDRTNDLEYRVDKKILSRPPGSSAKYKWVGFTISEKISDIECGDATYFNLTEMLAEGKGENSVFCVVTSERRHVRVVVKDTIDTPSGPILRVQVRVNEGF